MNSPEVFYLHINGEQRGPYTIRHIDHLLNCGLITEDALFWREGLEQWQPVTQLVVRRHVRKSWARPVVAVVVLLLIGLLVRVFGPITIEGWREANQSEFTKEAAYWRARDVVRNARVPKGALVDFDAVENAAVELHGSDSAVVQLRGSMTDKRGEWRPASWQVRLRYDPKRKEWSGIGATDVAQQ